MGGRPKKLEVPAATVTLIETGKGCDKLPLDPWTVTVYVPAATLLSTVTVSVEVPEPPLTDVVPRDAFTPELELDHVSVTVPMNPFAGLTVMVVVPELPAWIVSDDGFEDREKSGAATA